MEKFSSPGRIELIGNHTDHNGGLVLSCSTNLETIADAEPNNTNIINIKSAGYDEPFRINLSDIHLIKRKGAGLQTFKLLIGLIDGMNNAEWNIGGFDATISTNILSGSGISSSASFEMLFCCIVDYFFNDNSHTYLEWAKIGQYAENNYWNKPSGLMDQLTCAVGNAIMTDFSNEITYRSIDFNLEKYGYSMFLIDTGASHAKLTNEYSDIPNEMFEVAHNLNVSRLCNSNINHLVQAMPELKNNLSHRALLRAMHFYEENTRVEKAAQALEQNDFASFMSELTASGNSSWKYLQNCYVSHKPAIQNVSLALSLVEYYISTINDGCCRIHGGGFAGTILAFIPDKHSDDFQKFMKQMLDTSIYKLGVNKYGARHL